MTANPTTQKVFAAEQTYTLADPKHEYSRFQIWHLATFPDLFIPSSASYMFDAWMASAREVRVYLINNTKVEDH